MENHREDVMLVGRKRLEYVEFVKILRVEFIAGPLVAFCET